MEFDLGITSGSLVLETGVVDQNVYIKDGRIAAISDENLSCTKVIDAPGKMVFPGGVDPHVHLNEPGYTERDDYEWGTRAAAAGGITTIIEMPNSNPVTSDLETFADKRRIGEAKSIVDFGLYYGLTAENFSNIDELMEARPCAFKAFMSASPSLGMLDDGLLLEGMKAISRNGTHLAVHCENNDIIVRATESLKSAGRKDPLAYSESRPPLSENEAVQRAVNFAEVTGAHLHVVHTSSYLSVDIAAAARERGVSVSVETAPQYLTLNGDDFVRLGPFGQVKPPIRDEENRNELWTRIADGRIDCLGSDHSAHTREVKEAGIGDIWESPAGLPGLQTMLPAFLSEGLERGIPASRLAEVMATSPSQLFDLFPRKGVIRVGSDADFFLYDPALEWMVDPERLHYKNHWSPFDGRTFRGRIVQTILRGVPVYRARNDEDEILVAPGFGEFLPGGRN